MTEYQTIEGTAPQARTQHEPRTIKRVEAEDKFYMMTEIGDGTFVQWDKCRACSRMVVECKCATGPVEPDYMQKWRTERFTHSFRARGIEPGATPYELAQLLKLAQRAQDAALGDSNDEEIDLLREALETALHLLGQKLPEPDEDDGLDPDNLTGMDLGDGLSDDERDHAETGPDGDARTYDPETGEKIDPAMDNALDDALERVRQQKESEDVGF